MSYYGSGESSGASEAEFTRLTQTIATSIQKILQNVSSMQRMVNQFNTPQDSPELKQQLHQIRTYTQRLVKDTDGAFEELGTYKERHLKIQRDRLADEFATALTAFKAVQQKAVGIEKSAVRQARSNNYTINKPPGSTSNANANSGSNGSGSLFEDNFIDNKSQSQIQMQEEIDLQALEDQERTIRELEENIVGVNEIYKKLGAMVYEQGTMVDSIEASVEQTSNFVLIGSEQLKKATQYKNKLRKKKVILAIVLAIVLAIIIMIIAWRD